MREAAMQLQLFAANKASKALVYANPGECRLSRFNTRKTRPAADVQKLAERIKRNGFELTRAPWVIQVGDAYEVFAGGTRWEAATAAAIDQIPLILHAGFTDEEISRLADLDNENDEYHARVPDVDVWLEYKRLSDEEGWTQQRIAEAKGVGQAAVARRIAFAGFSRDVLSRFIQTPLLNEAMATELMLLSKLDNLAPWLDRPAIMAEIVDDVLDKARPASPPTASKFAAAVVAINATAGLANELRGKFKITEWDLKFLGALAERHARTSAEVQQVYAGIAKAREEATRKAEEDARAKTNKAEAEQVKAEQEARRAAAISDTLAKVVHGDARQAMQQAPDGIRLLLTDPPYGQEFKSNRKAGSKAIANDDSDAFALLVDVLAIAYPKMAPDSTVLIFSSPEHEPTFRQIVAAAGFTWKGQIIWKKPNHGTGDLEGGHAPQHECIIHAVKGNPKLEGKRPPSVLEGAQFMGAGHPTEKPMDLLRQLVEAHTRSGQLVADPFAGTGATVLAAYDTGRDFFACELDRQWHQSSTEALYARLMAGQEVAI